MEQKIKEARAYVAKLEGKQDAKSLRNDAANIFASNYSEYGTIWTALQEDK